MITAPAGAATIRVIDQIGDSILVTKMAGFNQKIAGFALAKSLSGVKRLALRFQLFLLRINLRLTSWRAQRAGSRKKLEDVETLIEKFSRSKSQSRTERRIKTASKTLANWH